MERQRHHGGRERLFTDVQETAIINMVLANNAIKIREIREHILNNDTIFKNINAVSLSTTHPPTAPSDDETTLQGAI